MRRSLPRRAAVGWLACLFTACATPRPEDRARGPEPGVEHVVLMWLHEPGDAAARERVLAASRALRAVPGVLDVRAGTALESERAVVDDSFDVGAVFAFADPAAVRDYLEHPDHVRAVTEVLRPLVERLVVYDILVSRN